MFPLSSKCALHLFTSMTLSLRFRLIHMIFALEWMDCGTTNMMWTNFGKCEQLLKERHLKLRHNRVKIRWINVQLSYRLTCFMLTARWSIYMSHLLFMLCWGEVRWSPIWGQPGTGHPNSPYTNFHRTGDQNKQTNKRNRSRTSKDAATPTRSKSQNASRINSLFLVFVILHLLYLITTPPRKYYRPLD